MHDFERFELGPAAQWSEAVGASPCCGDAFLEVLLAPMESGICEPLAARCGGCHRMIFADDMDRLAL